MYCGNNPVMYADPSGYFAITALLIGVIATALIGGTISGVASMIGKAEDEKLWGAFLGGFINGAIAGLGLGVALATGGVGGLIIAGITGFAGGFIGNIVSQQISYGNIQWELAVATGFFSTVVNMTAFVGITVAGIVQGATFLERLVSALYPSIAALGSTGYLATLALPNFNEYRKKDGELKKKLNIIHKFYS